MIKTVCTDCKHFTGSFLNPCLIAGKTSVTCRFPLYENFVPHDGQNKCIECSRMPRIFVAKCPAYLSRSKMKCSCWTDKPVTEEIDGFLVVI